MLHMTQGIVRGTDREGFVLWDEGKLSGSPIALAAVLFEFRNAEGSAVGPIEGPYHTGDHKADPNASAIVISRAFEKGYTFTGNLPQRSRVSPGGIG
jgi:hypothetical protein